VFITLLVVELR